MAVSRGRADAIGYDIELVGYPSDGATGVPIDVRPVYDAVFAGIDDARYDFQCVQVAARAPNGTLSEPKVLCGDDAPLREYERAKEVSCTPSGLAVEGAEPVDGGCTISSRRGGSASSAGWLLALFAVASLVRKRSWRPWNEPAVAREKSTA